MRHVFLHLRGHTDELLDPNGLDCADMTRVREVVLHNARNSLGEELKASGDVDLRLRIDAEDDAGAVIYSLSFADAVNLIHEVAA